MQAFFTGRARAAALAPAGAASPARLGAPASLASSDRSCGEADPNPPGSRRLESRELAPKEFA